MHDDNLASAWGVSTEYRDVDHNERRPPLSTVEAVLGAMGANAEGPEAPGAEPVLLVRDAMAPDLGGPWELTLEDGSSLGGSGRLPADLPFGYHWLEREDGQRTLVLSAPSACPPAAPGAAHGWAVQLYATRSRLSWGIGDFRDLAQLGRICGRHGANMMLVNPLHACLPGLPQEASPYYPSSRTFRNPIYISVEDVPGVDDPVVGQQGRGLNESRHIDRDKIWFLKLRALESAWHSQRNRYDKDFDAYVEARGESLHRYALFCVISEMHGRPWQSWPRELRHPMAPGSQVVASTHDDRIRFHKWLQWLAEVQLTRAGESIDLMHDLAIGVDPSGADSWLYQDVYAPGMRVGAPPDTFNAQGQNWNLPPYDPWKLRNAHYEPLIGTIRAALAGGHGGGVRIDHVMGLFRLFWIPEGEHAGNGTYVRYRHDEILAILSLEATRAGAYVVGEDLGTVEPETRDELKRRNVASYRLAWFESKPPPEFPDEAMAAVTTHDLPTVAGLFSRRDEEVLASIDQPVNTAAIDEVRHRVTGWLGMDPSSDIEEIDVALHELLGSAPCAFVTATLEDAIGVRERPNYPGTTDEWPNWSLALDVPLEDLEGHALFRRIAEAICKKRNELNVQETNKLRDGNSHRLGDQLGDASR